MDSYRYDNHTVLIFGKDKHKTVGQEIKKYADKIGADGYSQNAVEAVKLAKRLLNIA